MAKSIAHVLSQATCFLAADTDTAKLDAELLLAFVLSVSRSYLYSNPEYVLTAEQDRLFNQLIDRRKQNEPVAYLLGHQEFWSLDFIVTPDVLIPRSDTELLVELSLQLLKDKAEAVVADLGTGSGAIAVTLAHEKPLWQVHAVDQSLDALKIARKNAELLLSPSRKVIFHHGNWLKPLQGLELDLIVSNPPYIAKQDEHLSSGLRYEPQMALVSGVDGLDAVREIIISAHAMLSVGGYLLLEHGYDQAEQVRELFAAQGYQQIRSVLDFSNIERATLGKK